MCVHRLTEAGAQDLLDFLQKGPAPIYFGFGSMVSP